MSVLLRFLGIESSDHDADEIESLRSIATELDRLEPERARFFAAFAYLLARAAAADLRIEESELAEMERALREVSGLGAEEARLVAQIAHHCVAELGASENYLVAREFKRASSREERLRLIECLFAVAAADDTISGTESAAILGIAEELGLTRRDALALRSAWRDKLAELRPLASERRG